MGGCLIDESWASMGMSVDETSIWAYPIFLDNLRQCIFPRSVSMAYLELTSSWLDSWHGTCGCILWPDTQAPSGPDSPTPMPRIIPGKVISTLTCSDVTKNTVL